MILLAFGVTIFDLLTRHTHLETNAPLLAALGTAATGRFIITIPQVPAKSKSQRHDTMGQAM
jgi:hypothetical protein